VLLAIVFFWNTKYPQLDAAIIVELLLWIIFSPISSELSGVENLVSRVLFCGFNRHMF